MFSETAMINRFRNVVSNVMGGVSALPRGEAVSGAGGEELALRLPYSRPDFLQLSRDEVQVSADHVSRPILVPRDIGRLPWTTGYAEVINAGKTRLNEDQARAVTMFVPKELPEDSPFGAKRAQDEPTSPGACQVRSPDLINFNELNLVGEDPLPYTFFGLFDGHAGTGAALMAVTYLHHHIQAQLSVVRDVLIAKRYALDGFTDAELQASMTGSLRRGLMDKTASISADNIVMGALEMAFNEMDRQIEEERLEYRIPGGCTALVALFFMGKLYIANAGDCRALLCRGEEVIQLSTDFTPEHERQRLQYLAYLKPELLHNEFTHLEFPRRISRKDIGKRVLYREAWMKGWAYKTITSEDTKFPLIYGEGKRTRVLATIGVTRGFGDHDLKVHDSEIRIKPFLSCVPEIKVYDMSEYDHSPDDVLILGSDGLWDVTSNDRAATLVKSCLTQFQPDERIRYTSAAQDLVMNARGLLKKGWRTLDDRPASGDDITAFVIPLDRYSSQISKSSSTESSIDAP